MHGGLAQDTLNAHLAWSAIAYHSLVMIAMTAHQSGWRGSRRAGAFLSAHRTEHVEKSFRSRASLYFPCPPGMLYPESRLLSAALMRGRVYRIRATLLRLCFQTKHESERVADRQKKRHTAESMATVSLFKQAARCGETSPS
ncbi:hypothetical protein CEXT_68931 [Caerostris extrusa]|uniref:Uncharacterized protein n=1 Tax=Caerostris extrusa TaxID=172846 RepID=A0AAV4THV1_CAEEX|nr:hypothetical protein CEXT_68931 [Caerostris extrusa]